METAIKKERIQYIDALRGFTMLLVVFAHVETFSFQHIENTTFLGDLFRIFRMPLFFFVSGFLSYKPGGDWTLRQCGTLAVKKLRIQLIPTLFLGLLYTYFCLGETFVWFITLPLKAGYWFTIVLLEMFLIYYAVRLICEKVNALKDLTLVVLLVIALALYTVNTINPLIDHVSNILSFTQTARYLVFFVLGMIASNYKETFFMMLDNGKAMLSILVAFLTLLIIYNKVEHTSTILCADVAGIFGLLIIFAFFRKYAPSFDSSTKLGKSLQYIGKRTLDIYLLHYFVLPKDLTALGNFFLQTPNIAIEFATVITLSLLIVGLCLLLSNTLRLSATTARALFGVRNA